MPYGGVTLQIHVGHPAAGLDFMQLCLDVDRISLRMRTS